MARPARAMPAMLELARVPSPMVEGEGRVLKAVL